MEFLYYLDDPEYMLKLFHDNWLEDGGWAVIGIDHYAENEDSLSWPEYVGVHMATRTTKEWEKRGKMLVSSISITGLPEARVA